MTPAEHSQHLTNHAQLTIDQSEALKREGWLRAQEREAKSNAWNAPEHSSLTDRARDNLGNHAALHLTTELFELEGQIKARQLELDHIRIVLAYDPVVVPSEET